MTKKRRRYSDGDSQGPCQGAQDDDTGNDPQRQGCHNNRELSGTLPFAYFLWLLWLGRCALASHTGSILMRVCKRQKRPQRTTATTPGRRRLPESAKIPPPPDTDGRNCCIDPDEREASHVCSCRIRGGHQPSLRKFLGCSGSELTALYTIVDSWLL